MKVWLVKIYMAIIIGNIGQTKLSSRLLHLFLTLFLSYPDFCSEFIHSSSVSPISMLLHPFRVLFLLQCLVDLPPYPFHKDRWPVANY